MEFVKRHDLPIFQLQQLLDFEGFGGVDIPYIGYTELTLNIPQIEGFKREILAFVQKDSKYSAEVPLIIGTLHINEILACATSEELGKLSPAWYAGALGSQVLAKLAQLEERPIIDQIDHYVRLTRDITIPAMQVHRTTGIAEIPVLTKRLNVMTEALPHREEIKGIEAIPSYETFKQGGNRIIIGLNNTTREKITLKRGTKVAKVFAANVIPPMLAPKERTDAEITEISIPQSGTERQANEAKMGNVNNITSAFSKPMKPEATPERLNELFEKLDLKGIEEWSETEQAEVHELMTEFQHLFALSDLELGCTSLVKNRINVNNPVPFKERYRRIPLQEFDEVRNHLQEMLKVGVIRKSVSPWASPVVLVRKKDGSLRFCIDLRKLNSRTIKDAYSLPRIEELLDCLNGPVIFTSLDLKAGYWQVKTDEDSIPLTPFTVGPLGFYEHVRMPFGLTNAPATFQRLMESCLGDLHLKYCIIYLYDIIIFSKTPGKHLKLL